MAATISMATRLDAGPAKARESADLITWRWRRPTTSATRASSAASRFSILISRTPSRFSIRAVDRFSVSTMAPVVAFLIRLPKRRMTQAMIGAPRKTTRVMRQSSQSM